MRSFRMVRARFYSTRDASSSGSQGSSICPLRTSGGNAGIWRISCRFGKSGAAPSCWRRGSCARRAKSMVALEPQCPLPTLSRPAFALWTGGTTSPKQRFVGEGSEVVATIACGERFPGNPHEDVDDIIPKCPLSAPTTWRLQSNALWKGTSSPAPVWQTGLRLPRRAGRWCRLGRRTPSRLGAVCGLDGGRNPSGEGGLSGGASCSESSGGLRVIVPAYSQWKKMVVQD